MLIVLGLLALVFVAAGVWLRRGLRQAEVQRETAETMRLVAERRASIRRGARRTDHRYAAGASSEASSELPLSYIVSGWSSPGSDCSPSSDGGSSDGGSCGGGGE